MAVTLVQLRDAAQQDSDKVGDGSVTNQAWAIFANQAVESLWRLLISNYRDLYYATYDFNLTASDVGASLDVANVLLGQFRIMIGLDLDPATSNRRRVRSRPFVNRNDDAWGRLWLEIPWAQDREYMLQGSKLIVVPYEKAAGHYRLHYRAAPTADLTTDDDVIDPEMEAYSEYLSVFMARKALAKEESDTGYCDQRLAEIRAEIVESATRNEADPFQIADVEDFC